MMVFPFYPMSLRPLFTRFSGVRSTPLLGTIVFGLSLIPIAPGLAQDNFPVDPPPSLLVRSALKVGNQGAEVMELQAILQLLGFYTGTIDGVFSPGTQAAVQAFQQAAGLTPTGQMGATDWNRLLPVAAPGSRTAPLTPASTALNPLGSTGDVPPNPTDLNAQSFPVPDAASQPPTVTPENNTSSSSSTAAKPSPSQPSPPPIAAENLSFPVLRKGDQGTAVEQLQQRLQGLGFYDGAIDGIFGEETENFVKAFQTEFNLEVDGIVGGATWDTLFNAP
jgi:peptidoglycan hydrolase-like protein with peptidoglycan-binding domain